MIIETGGIVTVTGAHGHSIPVTVNGAIAFTLAQAYRDAVNNATSLSVTPGDTVSGASVNEFVAGSGGAYTYPLGEDHFTTDTTSQVTINASAQPSTVVLESLVGTGGAWYIGGHESGTFIAGGGDNLFVGQSTGNYEIATSNGNDTIYGGTGSVYIAAGTGDNTVVVGNGSDTVSSTGVDQINAGTGSDQIFIFDEDSILRGSTGELNVLDSGLKTTITGAYGTTTVDARGSTDGLYTLNGNSTVMGGGDDTVNAGGGSDASMLFIAKASTTSFINGGDEPTSVVGAAGSRVVVTGDVLVTTAAGQETIDGSGSTGNMTMFMSNQFTGSAVSISGGSGNDTLVAGNGSQTLTGGAGANDFVLAQNGTLGVAQITISDFSTTDLTSLYGYGANEVATALSTAVTAGGSTTITLGDSSKVTFLGVQHLNASQFVGDK